MTDTPPSAPAPLVPAGAETDALVALIVTALVAEVKADATRDADKLDRAASAAIDDVAIRYDYPSLDDDDVAQTVFATAADVDPQTFDGLVALGAAYLKRIGMSYGISGYETDDPQAVRSRAAILAGLEPGHKSRFGVG